MLQRQAPALKGFATFACALAVVLAPACIQMDDSPSMRAELRSAKAELVAATKELREATAELREVKREVAKVHDNSVA